MVLRQHSATMRYERRSQRSPHGETGNVVIDPLSKWRRRRGLVHGGSQWRGSGVTSFQSIARLGHGCMAIVLVHLRISDRYMDLWGKEAAETLG